MATMMKRLALLLFPFFFLLGGCSTTPTKSSPIAEQVKQVRQALDELAESYNKKEEAGFFSKLDPSFQSLVSLKSRVQSDHRRFAEIKIDFKIDRVEVREKSTSTAVRWGGSWKSAAQSAPVLKKGHAIFVWNAGEKPLLIEIRGDAPFGIDSGGS